LLLDLLFYNKAMKEAGIETRSARKKVYLNLGIAAARGALFGGGYEYYEQRKTLQSQVSSDLPILKRELEMIRIADKGKILDAATTGATIEFIREARKYEFFDKQPGSSPAPSSKAAQLLNCLTYPKLQLVHHLQ
jgi:hypothetical protein